MRHLTAGVEQPGPVVRSAVLDGQARDAHLAAKDLEHAVQIVAINDRLGRLLALDGQLALDVQVSCRRVVLVRAGSLANLLKDQGLGEPTEAPFPKIERTKGFCQWYRAVRFNSPFKRGLMMLRTHGPCDFSGYETAQTPVLWGLPLERSVQESGLDGQPWTKCDSHARPAGVSPAQLLEYEHNGR